jgi:hypothetical protein
MAPLTIQFFFYITHQEQLLPSNILSSLPRWLHCQGGGGGKSELVLLAVAFVPNLRLCLVPLKMYYAKKKIDRHIKLAIYAWSTKYRWNQN